MRALKRPRAALQEGQGNAFDREAADGASVARAAAKRAAEVAALEKKLREEEEEEVARAKCAAPAIACFRS